MGLYDGINEEPIPEAPGEGLAKWAVFLALLYVMYKYFFGGWGGA